MRQSNFREFAELLGIEPSTLPLKLSRPAESRPPVPVPSERHEDLTDEEYVALEPHLPTEPRQVGAMSNREVINGLLWARANKRSLTHIPSRYGSNDLCRKRAERWAVKGFWDELRSVLPDLMMSEHRRAQFLALCISYSSKGERIRADRRRAR